MRLGARSGDSRSPPNRPSSTILLAIWLLERAETHARGSSETGRTEPASCERRESGAASAACQLLGSRWRPMARSRWLLDLTQFFDSLLQTESGCSGRWSGLMEAVHTAPALRRGKKECKA